MSYQSCADKAIDDFAKSLGGGFYPDWAGVKPSDWGASKTNWRTQAGGIIQQFETCCGVKISCPDSELDTLHDMALSSFDTYLVQKASLHSAKLALVVAQHHLTLVRASITTFRVR